MEPSVAKRDSGAIKRVWQHLCGQLLDYKSWESMGDSLYASSSLAVGAKQKKFALVIILCCTNIVTPSSPHNITLIFLSSVWLVLLAAKIVANKYLVTYFSG